jgi:hypothetical protein
MDEISVSDHVRLALAAYLNRLQSPVDSVFTNRTAIRQNGNDN